MVPGGGSYNVGYLKEDGEGALDPRELLDPNVGAFDLKLLEDDPFEWWPSRFSRTAGPDHSLSVTGEPTESSMSPALLVSPALLATEPEVRLALDELALKSFSFPFSFSSKSMKILERASL